SGNGPSMSLASERHCRPSQGLSMGSSQHFSISLAAALLFTGCATRQQPLHTVPYVDLPRYMGDWYVIANIPYFAEKECVESIESYALRPDGKIANWFRFRKKGFDAPQQRVD